MFPCMVARAATIDWISTGSAGIRNGALQVVCFSSVHFCFLSHAAELELIKILPYRCMLSFKFFHHWSLFVN